MKTKLSPKPRGDSTALLVIDVQIGLFKKQLPIYRAADLLSNINSLIERARHAGAPVIYVQHSNDSFLQKDTPEWQLHPELLLPGDDELRIYKRHASAFEGTDLEQELEARGVGNLVLGGLVTHGCVKAACLDACQIGYHVTLVADGHSSFSKDAAKLIDEWNTKLQQAGAQVIPAAKVDFISEAAIA
jgi:nicotinamidase-related amidase